MPTAARPYRPRIAARLAYLAGRLLAPRAPLRRLASALERRPRALAAFTVVEEASKQALFGCRMCGQCTLPATGYACPMTCPKQLRNGPCGGVAADGGCEVYPELQCVWVEAYERAEAAGHVADLVLLQRPVDHRLAGQSAWVRYWLGRDEDLTVPPRHEPARALAAGRFAVTAEIGPPRGPDPAAVARAAGHLRGWVDAANVTDNPSAHVQLGSLAGCVLAARAGVEPVMQLTCRDRNRIALQSELISAAALGVPNVLLLTGDHPRFGDHPEAAPVFDLDGVQLVWLARTLRDEGRLMSGRVVEPRPRYLIGAVENPFAPPLGFRAARLGKKVAAGAEFCQTQFVFDLTVFGRFMAEVVDRGLAARCAVLAGVGPVRSLRALEFLRTRVPGVVVPDAVGRRLRGVPAGRVADEGVALCAETIAALRATPGVAGVHVMAFGYERGVPEILERAGLPRVEERSRAG